MGREEAPGERSDKEKRESEEEREFTRALGAERKRERADNSHTACRIGDWVSWVLEGRWWPHN